MKKRMGLLLALLVIVGIGMFGERLRAAESPAPYRIHWTCTPITTYLGFSCFAYRDDTGEVIATKQIEATRKDLGMPVGTRP